MNILITGSTGLVGTALKKGFIEKGHDVRGLLRKKTGDEPFWDFNEGIIELGSFQDVDIVINLAGENIA